MGSAESSERNGNNNSTTSITTYEEGKDELKDMAKVAVAVAGAAAAAYGVCSILASINNKEEEDGPMMKAPGQNGVYIKRIDIENDPAVYFKGNRGK
ncbi:hypothetical protein LguiA_001657 [Lonicera macranthoides]